MNNINWKGEYYDKFNLKSINFALGDFGTSTTHTSTIPYLSERLSLQPPDYGL